MSETPAILNDDSGGMPPLEFAQEGPHLHAMEGFRCYDEARRHLDQAAEALKHAREEWLRYQTAEIGPVRAPFADTEKLCKSLGEIRALLPVGPTSGAGRGIACGEGPDDVCSLSEGGE